MLSVQSGTINECWIAPQPLWVSVFRLRHLQQYAANTSQINQWDGCYAVDVFHGAPKSNSILHLILEDPGYIVQGFMS